MHSVFLFLQLQLCYLSSGRFNCTEGVHSWYWIVVTTARQICVTRKLWWKLLQISAACCTYFMHQSFVCVYGCACLIVVCALMTAVCIFFYCFVGGGCTMSAKLKGQESAELCSLSCRCSLHLHVLVQKLLNTAQVLSQQSVMWSDWNSTIVFKQQRPFYPLGHDLLDLHTHTVFPYLFYPG